MGEKRFSSSRMDNCRSNTKILSLRYFINRNYDYLLYYIEINNMVIHKFRDVYNYKSLSFMGKLFENGMTIMRIIY